jgi:hypothetical protein
LSDIKVCIWCQRPQQKFSREHLIPEALGGNEQVVLLDAVCEPCNNRFGSIDRALVKDFEIVAWLNGVRGKRRKAPTVSSWAPLLGKHGKNGPELIINGGPQDITVDGRRLPKISPRTGVQLDKFYPAKGVVQFSHRFPSSQQCSRALFKIGLGLVARFYGAEHASSASFDHVRAYVLGAPGAGPRAVVIEQLEWGVLTSGFNNPLEASGSSFPMLEVYILGVAFLIDMHPEQKNLKNLRAAALLGDATLNVIHDLHASA